MKYLKLILRVVIIFPFLFFGAILFTVLEWMMDEKEPSAWMADMARAIFHL